jgi:hypothetical protein
LLLNAGFGSLIVAFSCTLWSHWLAIMKIKKLWINEDGNLMLYLYALVDAVSFTVFFLEDKQMINTHGE